MAKLFDRPHLNFEMATALSGRLREWGWYVRAIQPALMDGYEIMARLDFGEDVLLYATIRTADEEKLAIVRRIGQRQAEEGEGGA